MADGSGSPSMPSPSSKILLARLEYGKLCRPNGVIEDGAEHRILGYSRDFPVRLVRWAQPAMIGTRSSSTDPAPRGCSEGLVLRSVYLGPVPKAPDGSSDGRFHPVFARIGVRPENPYQSSSRRYTVARYLTPSTEVDPEETSPYTLFYTINGKSLDGLTHAASRRLSSYSLKSTPRFGEPDELDRAFLSRAVIYLLSGVPLALASRVEPDRFFHWVDLLWQVLPDPLRRRVTAGWGTGYFLSGALSLVYARSPGPRCALFDARDLSWKHPDLIGYELPKPPELKAPKAKSDWRLADFDDSVLELGRSLADEIYGLRDSWADFHTMPERAEVDLKVSWSQYDALPTGPTSDRELARGCLVDLRYRGFFAVQIKPGAVARDRNLTRLLQAWLRGQNADLDAETVLAHGFYDLTTRLRALEKTLEALSSSGQEEERALSVLWGLLSQAPSVHGMSDLLNTIDTWQKPGGAWARLLSAIALDDFKSWSMALGELRNDGITRALPRAAESAEHRFLNLSLQQAGSASGKHAQLLADDRPLPRSYERWVIQTSGFLLMDLSRNTYESRSVLEDAVGRIVGLNESMPGYQALGRWVLLKEPRSGDAEAILSRLSSKELSWLGQTCLKKWQSRRAEAMDILLRWIEQLRLPIFRSDPLLRIVTEGSRTQLEFKEASDIIEAVQGLELPPSIKPRIAAAALHSFDQFCSAIWQDTEGWEPLVRFWPKQTQVSLLGVCSKRTETHPESEAVAQELQLRIGTLELALGKRSSWRAGPVLDYFWQLASRAQGDLTADSLALAGLCHRLQSNPPQWSDVRESQRDPGLAPRKPSKSKRYMPPAPNSDQINLIFEIFKSPGPEAHLDRHFHILWQNAFRGWHLKLLLRLFPNRRPEPTTDRIELLVSERSWIRGPAKRLLDSDYYSKLELARHAFHSLDYEKHRELWHPGLQHSGLWAAFKKVPPSSQGHLEDALRVYSTNDSEAMGLLKKYLQSAEQGSSEHSYAVEQTLKVLLLLLKQGLDALSFRGVTLKHIDRLFFDLSHKDRLLLSDKGILKRRGLRLKRVLHSKKTLHLAMGDDGFFEVDASLIGVLRELGGDENSQGLEQAFERAFETNLPQQEPLQQEPQS